MTIDLENKISLENNAEINTLLKRISIEKLDDVTVIIHSKNISFSFTLANAVCKDEFKDKYRYFGGLQCNYEVGSEMYILLEKRLCLVAENVLTMATTYC